MLAPFPIPKWYIDFYEGELLAHTASQESNAGRYISLQKWAPSYDKSDVLGLNANDEASQIHRILMTSQNQEKLYTKSFL